MGSETLKYIISFIIFAKLADGYAIDRSRAQCRQPSKCVELRHCQPYMNLIEMLGKPLKPSMVVFLKAQECGFQEGYPMVCCSGLPKTLKVFKSAKPSKNSPNKQIDLELHEAGLKVTTQSITTTTPPLTTSKSIDMQKKEEELNRAFLMSDLYDMSDTFDLFRRRRDFANSTLNIEIR